MHTRTIPLSQLLITALTAVTIGLHGLLMAACPVAADQLAATTSHGQTFHNVESGADGSAQPSDDGDRRHVMPPCCFCGHATFVEPKPATVRLSDEVPPGSWRLAAAESPAPRLHWAPAEARGPPASV